MLTKSLVHHCNLFLFFFDQVCIFQFLIFESNLPLWAGNRCVICQMEYKRGDRRMTLPCKHVYHAGCGTRWLSINKVSNLTVSTFNPNSNIFLSLISYLSVRSLNRVFYFLRLAQFVTTRCLVILQSTQKIITREHKEDNPDNPHFFFSLFLKSASYRDVCFSFLFSFSLFT